MRSSPTSRSRFPSTTSALLVGAAWLHAGAGCGDDCGPMGAPSTGLQVSSVEVALSYGNMSSLVGNDCPAPDAPAGIISVSIEGHQDGDENQRITFCIPRPDLLDTGPRTIGTTNSTADVRIIDLQGAANGCTYTLDTTRPPTGSAIGLGVCGNGDDAAGFALDVDGAVSLRRTCGGTVDTIAVTIKGRVAVSRRQN